MIPQVRAADEPPAKVDGAVSHDVIGRYRATGFTLWCPSVLAVTWVLWGTVQFVETHQWQGLAFAVAWTALAVQVWMVPNTVISDKGVRFSGLRRIIPWSEVVEIVVRPSGKEWKPNHPDLVLREGVRRPLSDIDPSHVESLRSLARRNGAPLPIARMARGASDARVVHSSEE